jgi:hypothetical protein
VAIVVRASRSISTLASSLLPGLSGRIAKAFDMLKRRDVLFEQ